MEQMQILTIQQCRQWVEGQGQVFEPYGEGCSWTAQFETDDAKDQGQAAKNAILQICKGGGKRLLVIKDHPLTYRDRRQRLSKFRRSVDAHVSLVDAPGHLMDEKENRNLATLLNIVIGPGSWWSVYVYLPAIQTTILVWESSLLDLWSQEPKYLETLRNYLPKSKNS